MASKGHMICRLVLQNAKRCVNRRFYATVPPKTLGGVPFKQLEWQYEEVTATYAEQLAKLQAVDADLTNPINIGMKFTPDIPPPNERRRIFRENRKDGRMEYAARHKELTVPIDEAREDWLKEYGPQHIRTVVDHYGIYRDLFNGAYFLPTQQMRVAYDYDDEFVVPVYFGNDISPEEASSPPHVEFEAEADSLYTLLLTNPDGHLTENDSEYLHWLVGNIPSGEVSQGEVLCNYLKPFPPQGTGFHRHVFLLFKQKQRLDYSTHRRADNCSSLKERTFHTVEFFRALQDELTPVAINFFQAEWDDSVKQVYHSVLNMKEPKFEYQHPPPYHPPQETYPYKQPFNRYMDRYRDKKDLAEEVMRLKLSMVSPYKEYTPPIYPLIHHNAKIYKPSWLRRKEEMMHRRGEQFKDLPQDNVVTNLCDRDWRNESRRNRRIKDCMC